MRETRLCGFSFFRASSDSWLGRVRENFWQLFVSARLAPSSANGAPIHLLRFERSTRSRHAQTLSLLTHGAVIAAISLVASRVVHDKAEPEPQISVSMGALVYTPETNRFASQASLGPKAGGGDHAALPVNHGFLAPRSSIQLAPTRSPDNANHLLPMTATFLDAQAPPVVAPQNDLGLPWMLDNAKSGGRVTAASARGTTEAWETARDRAAARVRATCLIREEFWHPHVWFVRTRSIPTKPDTQRCKAR